MAERDVAVLVSVFLDPGLVHNSKVTCTTQRAEKCHNAKRPGRLPRSEFSSSCRRESCKEGGTGRSPLSLLEHYLTSTSDQMTGFHLCQI